MMFQRHSVRPIGVDQDMLYDGQHPFSSWRPARCVQVPSSGRWPTSFQITSAPDRVSLLYLDDPPAAKAGHPQKVVCNRGKAAGPIDGVQSPKAAEH
jgi:hypothetical protein